MQFEKIRKLNKNKIIIGGLIGLSILTVGILATSKAKYKVTQSVKVGTGTVNYKVPDFNVVAMYSSEDGNDYTQITRMPTNGYVINETESYCNINGTKDESAVLKTVDGNHVISNLQVGSKCFLYFDKKTTETIVASFGNIEVKLTEPNFANTATTDEGIFKVTDGMYGNDSYYWRGAVTNNHVIFANLCWRIVRINGDKSIRLIYNGTPSNSTCPGNGENATSIAKANQAYYENVDRSEYVGYTFTEGSQRGTTTESNLKKQTESWFNSKITGTNLEKVADGYFCNDRNVASGTWFSQSPGNTFNYAARGRLQTNKKPTLSCIHSSDIYTLKAGAITADEIAFAGGVWNNENKSYYLYNGQNYWTMSPNIYEGYYTGVFNMNNIGKLYYSYIHTSFGIRPVINLKSTTTFISGGQGTSSSPYVVQ